MNTASCTAATMPKMGRRMAGRAAMAISLRKERAKEHLKQMLEQSRSQSNDDALQALLKVRRMMMTPAEPADEGSFVG